MHVYVITLRKHNGQKRENKTISQDEWLQKSNVVQYYVLIP